MFNKRRMTSYIVATLAIAGVVAVATTYLPEYVSARAVVACGGEASNELQVECVFRILKKEMNANGVEATMNVFAQAYNLLPGFTVSGCHPKAHRVGDVAYYTLYVGTEDLDAIDFSQNTSACSFGFYHGFIEHLIQDHPVPDFIDKSCLYFKERLESTMRDIYTNCYHAAGHGLLLDQTTKVARSEWGDISAFVEAPAMLCSQLAADDEYKESCLTGIFNVLGRFREANQYGFSYDYEHPFAICEKVSENLKYACFSEMSRKLDKASNLDIQKLQALVAQAPTVELQENAFLIGIGGFVANESCATNTYVCVLEQCSTLSGRLYDICLKGVVRGVYERGVPQEEYKEALMVCLHPIVQNTGSQSLCYKRAADSLTRFYTTQKIAAICRDFPEAYRSLCTDQLTLRQ